MLRVLTLCIALALVGCGPHAADAPAVNAEAEQFLIDAAAGDFQRHVAPHGAAFRAVHPGVLQGQDGARVHIICGEVRKSADDPWTPFATIKTSGYENWIGGTAAGYCSADGTALDTSRDLAESLIARYAVSQ